MTARRSFALLLAVFACHAAAQSPPASGSDAGAAVFGQPMSGAALQMHRGGTRATFNDMQLSGATTSNTARGVNTGHNVIDGSSFANLNGIPVVIQNTGANVLIQSAVILNLQMN